MAISSERKILFLKIENGDVRIIENNFEFSATPSALCRKTSNIVCVCLEDGENSEIEFNYIAVNNEYIVNRRNLVASGVYALGNYYAHPYQYICGVNTLCKLSPNAHLEDIFNHHDCIFVDITMKDLLIFILDTKKECIWWIQAQDMHSIHLLHINEKLSCPFGMCKSNNSLLIADSGNSRIIELDVTYDEQDKVVAIVKQILPVRSGYHPIKITCDNSIIVVTVISSKEYVYLNRKVFSNISQRNEYTAMNHDKDFTNRMIDDSGTDNTDSFFIK